MQNKGLIKLFALLFGLVSIYQLSYTFVTSKVEKEANTFATSRVSEAEEGYVAKREIVAASYLDSIGSNPILGYTDYNEAKRKNLIKVLTLKVVSTLHCKSLLRTFLKDWQTTRRTQFLIKL